MTNNNNNNNNTNTINKWINFIGEYNAQNGWHDNWDLKEKLLMVHTEISEAVEELRIPGHYTDQEYYNPGSLKPEGFAVEIADAIIRLFDIVYVENIDLEYMLYIKSSYNKTRGYRHGGKLI